VSYIGRFAPSPTGELHLGTLTAAVASFLHAKQMDGTWLVRIEDIDPPREVPGSAASILESLDALDLQWDGDVLFQSARVDRYLAHALELVAAGQAYYCSCSRQDIRALTGGTLYPGTCRDRSLPAGDTAIRLRTDIGTIGFVDRLHGEIRRNIEAADGDFVIVRRDGLPAYHLAVVIDDAEQRITDIVRGADLLDSTPLHVLLQRRLALATPNYWHIPLVTDTAGEKLSKRAGAPPVDTANPGQTAAAVLELLGLDLPADLNGAPPKTLWQWAEQHWRIDALVERRYS
jgi:glutamyl-Q tRNA(Asp) synthetase